MNVDIQTVLAFYDEKIMELTKENIMLKSQLKQMETNSQNETQPEGSAE
jgi:hypothetical protein